MSLTTLCLALCPILVQPSAGVGGESASHAPAPVADEAALLVPADAFVVLRFESAQDLLALVQAFAALSDASVPADVPAMLENMNVPGDRSQIDVTRPALLALSLGAGEPLPTTVIPTLDAQAYADSLAGEPNGSTAISGSYVGFSGTRNYAVGSEPSALAAAVRPGLISAHMDLGALIQTYRPMIEMGLDQVEMMLDQMDEMADSPMDMGAMLELYMDGIWAFVDSAAGLDLLVDFDGRSLAVRADLGTKPKSPMAAFGGDASYDLHPAASYLDPQSSLTMLFASDFGRMFEQYGSMMDALFDAYPEPLATDMRRYMTAYKDTLPLMGKVAAASGDFGPGGMRLVYSIEAPDPAALATSLNAVMGTLATAPEGSAFAIAPPAPVTIGGLQATRSRLTFDMRALLAALAEEDGAGQEQLAMMEGLMKEIYGADGMDITMGALEKRLVMIMGGDAAYAEQGFKRAPGKFADLPADLRQAIDAASGSSTALVYRFDYGQIMSQLANSLASMGLGDMSPLQSLDAPFPVTAWMGIRGTTWSSGGFLDMQGLQAFAKAMRELEQGLESIEEEEDEF